MSITGGLFNTGHKKDDVGDTKTTADGDTTATESPAADLTTSIPGFDDTDDGFIVETGGEFEDTDGESWGANLDVESVTSEGTNVDVESVTSEGTNVDVESVTSAGSGEDLDFDVDAPGETRLDPES